MPAGAGDVINIPDDGNAHVRDVCARPRVRGRRSWSNWARQSRDHWPWMALNNTFHLQTVTMTTHSEIKKEGPTGTLKSQKPQAKQ